MRFLPWLVVASAVAYAQPSVPIAPDELRYTLFDRVVIADAQRNWGAGPITVEHVPSERDTRLVMTREIDPRRVPAAVRAWRNRGALYELGDRLVDVAALRLATK